MKNIDAMAIPRGEMVSEEAMVDRLQRSAFEYFLTYTNKENGLVPDTSFKNVPCSIAAVGFALSSYPVAVERGWMTREAAAEIVRTTLNFFANSHQGKERHASGYRGFYYHFLHMDTGHRAWNSELSTIDTALLIAGVLTAAEYFTDEGEEDIRETARFLYERVDWQWALNKGQLIAMGWKPASGFLRWRYEGYDEAILLYVLALGSPTHPIPSSSYRAFTTSYRWREFGGKPYLDAGPLFIHLFSHAWIDFRDLQDQQMAAHDWDYFRNTQQAIAVQRDYAERNPKGFVGYNSNVWGLSACDGPSPLHRVRGNRKIRFFGYSARGAPNGPDDGTLAPWCALASLPFDRDAALKGTQTIIETYPNLLMNGQFPGGFNPTIKTTLPEGWIDDRTVAIDQGLLVVSVENARNDFLWKLMRGSEAIKTGLQRAGFSGGWLGKAADEDIKQIA
ncbi:glucoamylase family protein [Oryzifoliimicrobium ureilyticus]|uniref:glucoamylase family protein n=1 Tax=Oryzifoliimicrobium ureilyticus TaxID=3113724 RepID=UPI00307661BC